MTLDELDKLAAEKVMGRHKIRVGERYDWKIGHDEIYGNPFTIMQEHWQPTRNISQAFECLEKSGFKDFSVYSIPRRSDEFRLNVRFACRITEENFFCDSGICDTASEAIVRACLKAKGVEV